MFYDGIKVKFTYESQESQTIICKPNEKLKTVSQKFCLNKGINFKKVYFLFDGKKIEKADYNKEVSELIQTNIRDELNILVYDINLSETTKLNSDDFDKECEVIFWFKSRPNSIKCKLKSKMLDICQNIAKICGKDLYSIDFIFKDKKIDMTKIFEEIANEIEKEEGKIELKVEEIHVNNHYIDTNNDNKPL